MLDQSGPRAGPAVAWQRPPRKKGLGRGVGGGNLDETDGTHTSMDFPEILGQEHGRRGVPQLQNSIEFANSQRIFSQHPEF